MPTKARFEIVLIVFLAGAYFAFRYDYAELGNNVVTYATGVALVCVGVVFAHKRPKLSDAQKQDMRDAAKKYPFTTMYPIRDSLTEINADVEHYGGEFFVTTNGMLFMAASMVFGVIALVRADMGALAIVLLALPIVVLVALFFFFTVVQKCFNFLAFAHRVTKKIATTPHPFPGDMESEAVLKNLAYYKRLALIDLYIAAAIAVAVVGFAIFS